MKHYSGVTLPELLAVLVIVAVLLALTVPSMRNTYQRNQMTVMEKELKAAIQHARNQALLSGVPMTLNPDPVSHNWSDGMILFADNARHLFGKTDKIHYQWQWRGSDISVEWYGFRSRQYLIFSPELRKAASSGHFELSGKNLPGKKIVINRLGRVKS